MRRRDLLKAALSAPFLSLAASWSLRAQPGMKPLSRVRPGDANWPGPEQWDALKAQVSGRLIVPESPFVEGDAAVR